MTSPRPQRQRRDAPRSLLTALVCVLAMLGCTPERPVTELDHAVAKEAATQAPGMVDVTLYFRQGRGADAALVPVVREVPVGSDLAHTALSLMLQGPSAADPPTLQPAVPTTTNVRSFALDGGTATVDLSGHVVTDAADVGKRPEHELLALAAVANTLTEFPEITRVVLTVDGEAGGAFWGGWGLPRVLLRDDSVIAAEAATVKIPDLGAFSRRDQEVGGPRQTRAMVSSVRIHPRSTYLRVTLELTEVDGTELVGPVPKTRVSRRGDDVSIAVAADAAAGLAGEQVIDDPTFAAAHVDVRESRPSVRVTVRPDRPAAFALRTLTDPTRVALDIRR